MSTYEIYCGVQVEPMQQGIHNAVSIAISNQLVDVNYNTPDFSATISSKTLSYATKLFLQQIYVVTSD